MAQSVSSLHIIQSEEGEGRADGDESVVEMRRRQWYRLQRERGWHIWVHTHEHCESRSGRSGHRTLHTSLDTSGLTRTRGPGPTIGALSDTAGHREPEKANRGRWMVEPMSRPDCGWLWPGSGEGCHWCGPGWAHWGSVLTPHQAVAVRVTEDKHQWGRDTHWPHQAVTLTNPRSRGRDTPSLVSVVAKQKANVFMWSQIEAGWSLNRFIMVIRNSNQSNTIIKLT